MHQRALRQAGFDHVRAIRRDGPELRARIADDLYPPNASGEVAPALGVAICHGFTGLEENVIPFHAEAFADAGLIAVLFDDRGFDQSDGQRRRLL